MDKKNRPEILAPVGGAQQLLAAVRAGADAVYFGMSDFNARRNADNFADDELEKSIAYCHTAGVKVYITVNTLVKDSEISAMQKAVDRAALAGADALIIQDLAVASYVKAAWPNLHMHASTQMAVHNSEGVKKLLDYGFKRVVLARELSLNEMRSVREKTGAELEVFVHGAHCMSASGNCYMSSMFGGRSGNRGLCAQPCRLDWSIDGKNYCLSLKDMSYMEHLQEIAEIGIASLKIEGRMKRPEYVAAATLSCKNALEGKPYDTKALQSVFSRSGFTDGYLTGKRDSSMFGYRTKEDVTAAPAVLKDLEKIYEKETPRVPLDFYFFASEQDNSSLTVSDGEHSVTVLGDAPQKAKTMPLTKEAAQRSLSKTGGTPYFVQNFDCYIADGIMLPASALNSLRRSALSELTKERVKPGQGDRCFGTAKRFSPLAQPGETMLRLRFEKAEQIFDGAEKAELIILPLSEIEKKPELLQQYKGKICAELPDLIYEGDTAKTSAALKELKARGLKDAMCGNIGGIKIAQDTELKVHGSAMLNALNSAAAAELKDQGLSDICLSFEMSFANMKQMKTALPFGFISYGRLPLMKFRACPARGPQGCGSCTGCRTLADRYGTEFPLLCRRRGYSELLNSVPLYTADKQRPAANFEILYFTTETKQECGEIAELCKIHSAPPFPRTAGLYFREIL